MGATLKKSLTLPDLIIFGLNFMIPLAPAIVFGVIANISGGSVALPFLIGFIAMLFTGYSFIKMARKYPNAGSVFTYVSKSIGGTFGFIAGWMIIMDYLLSPAITTSSAAIYLQKFFPNVPYSFLVLAFITITGFIAISGAKVVSRTGLIVLILGELVVVASIIIYGHYVATTHGATALISSHPFHFTNFHTLLAASAIAAMGFFGFDAISTMSEETKNPTRNIPLAIFITLLIGATTMVLTGYFGSLVQPNNSVYHQTIWQNAALFYISKIAGGPTYANVYVVVFIISMIFLNVVAISAVSRIMFSMSREGKLPKIFAKLSPKFNTPYIGILFVMAIEAVVALFIHLELLSELISFGALSGFILLNIGVLKTELKDSPNSLRIKALIPFIGTCILSMILITINVKAIYVGTSWLMIGACVLFLRSRKNNNVIEFNIDESNSLP